MYKTTHPGAVMEEGRNACAVYVIVLDLNLGLFGSIYLGLQPAKTTNNPGRNSLSIKTY